MVPFILFCGLLLLLFSFLVGLESVAALSIATVISAVAATRGVSRGLVVAFWVWLNAIFGCLLHPEFVFTRILSLEVTPAPLTLMLVGIWILPVLLWPLGFALTFDKWRKR